LYYLGDSALPTEIKIYEDYCVKTLNYRLNYFTTYHFVNLFLNNGLVFKSEIKEGIDIKQMGGMIISILDILIDDNRYLDFSPLQVAWSIFSIARENYNLEPISQVFCKIYGIKAQNILPCFFVLKTVYKSEIDKLIKNYQTINSNMIQNNKQTVLYGNSFSPQCKEGANYLHPFDMQNTYTTSINTFPNIQNITQNKNMNLSHNLNDNYNYNSNYEGSIIANIGAVSDKLNNNLTLNNNHLFSKPFNYTASQDNSFYMSNTNYDSTGLNSTLDNSKISQRVGKILSKQIANSSSEITKNLLNGIPNFNEFYHSIDNNANQLISHNNIMNSSLFSNSNFVSNQDSFAKNLKSANDQINKNK
jgi:hypothetical protein